MKRTMIIGAGVAALALMPAAPAAAASSPPANCNGQVNSYMSSTYRSDIAGLTAWQAHDVWTTFGVPYGMAVTYVGQLDPATCTDAP